MDTTSRLAAQAREELDRLREQKADLQRELDGARRDLKLYANTERLRERAEAERDRARRALEVMIEQLQLGVTFEAWREHRLYVAPTDERRDDWREHAWRALHGDALPELGSRHGSR